MREAGSIQQGLLIKTFEWTHILHFKFSQSEDLVGTSSLSTQAETGICTLLNVLCGSLTLIAI